MKTIFTLFFISSLFAVSLNAADDSKVKKNRGHKADFEASDKDKDGKLSKEEYLASQTQRIERRLKRLDKDSDGLLTKEEFTASSRRKKSA